MFGAVGWGELEGCDGYSLRQLIRFGRGRNNGILVVCDGLGSESMAWLKIFPRIDPPSASMACVFCSSKSHGPWKRE